VVLVAETMQLTASSPRPVKDDESQPNWYAAPVERSWSFMELKTLIRLGTGVLLVSGIAAGAAIIMLTSSLTRSIRPTLEAIQGVRASQELEIGLLLEAAEPTVPLERSGYDRQTYLRDRFSAVLGQVDGAEEAALVGQLRPTIEAAIEGPDPQPMSPVTLGTLLRDVQKLVDLNVAQAEARIDAVVKKEQAANAVALAIMTVMAVLVAGLGWTVRNRVLGPLRDLRSAIRGVGSTAAALAPSATQGVVEIEEIRSSLDDMAARLEESRKTQLRFLAGVAHDLRNPLSALSMSIALMRDGRATDDKDDAEFDMLSQLVMRQVKMLERMIGDLLDTASVEAGSLTLRRSEIDVVELARDVVKLFQTASALHTLVLDCEGAESVRCHCDPTRIGQVLTNLISNAIKYSPDGGVVSVTFRRDGARAVISVADHGIGIAPEDLGRVFEPFSRTAASRDRFPGVGLGLSVARKLAVAHGGDLTVQSTRGKGSVFTLVLPALEPVMTPQSLAAVALARELSTRYDGSVWRH
jgi:signal transduction histidine kinase